MTMERIYFDILHSLAGCHYITIAAEQNLSYMRRMIKCDPTLVDYANKVKRMEAEAQKVFERCEELRKYLQEYNNIAMR